MDALTAINWMALIAFYIGIFFFFHKHKKDVAKQWGIFFMYRTQKGLDFIRNLARRLRGFWVAYGYVGIPIVFLMMFGMVVMLIVSVINMFFAPKAAAPVAGIVVPWATTGIHGAVITVSIWYFIIAVVVTLLVHEGAHAVIAASHKMRLKSAGVGLFAVIPFAFVEPDEKQIEKAETRKKLAVFSAGPFTNIIIAIIFILLTFFLILPPLADTMQINGLEIDKLDESMPAGLSELEEGDVIVRIDDTSFVDVQPETAFGIAISFEGLLGLPNNKLDALTMQPGQTAELETADGKVVELTAETAMREPTFMDRLAIKLGTKDEEDFGERGALGIISMRYAIDEKQGTNATKLFILSILYSVLMWVAIFNLGIGLFNTLPIGPLDGGRMMRASLAHIFKKRKKVGAKLFTLISIAILAVLLFGVFGAYLVRMF